MTTTTMDEITLEELKEEIRGGAKCILQLRHAERSKIAPDDPTFGDAIHLTREGLRTARIVGRSLAEFASCAAFASSPLTRTRETAAAVAEGMGLSSAEIPAYECLGNGSFYYEDPAEVLRVFQEKDFFNACFEYFEKGRLSGFRDLYAATDECERFLEEQSAGRRLFVAVTHDLYIAAFLSARKAYGPFTLDNWPRFLDGCAMLSYPDGRRRCALVRAGLSRGICGVKPVRGVVFDFGGVMAKSTEPVRIRTLAASLGIPWKVFEDGFAKYRCLMDGDYLKPDEMYELVFADAGIVVPPEAAAKFPLEDWDSFFADEYKNAETLAFMRRLKDEGYKIGILTNMPSVVEPMFRREYAEYVALADAVVVSGAERMFKPQKRIYELMLSRLGVGADEVCFFDDVEANCEGARALGWRAIRFSSAAQAEREFRERFA